VKIWYLLTAQGTELCYQLVINGCEEKAIVARCTVALHIRYLYKTVDVQINVVNLQYVWARLLYRGHVSIFYLEAKEVRELATSNLECDNMNKSL
jgi:hypothetical protein